MTPEPILATIILIIALLMFLFMFGIVAFTFLRWIKTPTYQQPSAIKVEEYSCPKCGSKDLEIVGRRTLRCKRCGTTFTVQPETSETYFIVWPFLWWIPIILPIPSCRNG